jgi:hypothetical protein
MVLGFSSLVAILMLSVLFVRVPSVRATNPPDEWPMFHHDLNHTGYSTSAAPNTNQSAWSYTTGDEVFSSPAVAGGMVYVGSGDGKVYCLDAATGAFVWSYTTGSSVFSSPAVAGGMVYVGSDKVYCLDAATGAFVWSYTTGNAVYSSPAVVSGMVYVGSTDSKVYCLDAATGAFVWSYTTGSSVFSSPAVAGGMVYVGSDKVYCLDAATGAFVWSYTTGHIVWSSPAVAGGMVYVGSYNRNVYCLDAATGAFVWGYTTGHIVWSSPAVAGGMVYVGSYDGKVYAFGPTMLQLAVVSAYDSPSPTSGVFTYGTSITASVTSPVAGPAGTQYVCTGWTGTGDVPASGTGTTLTFTITQNSSITWNWKTQYYLTVKTIPTGAATIAGQGWYDALGPATLSAPPVSGIYHFRGWDVDGTMQGNTNPISVQMNGPHTATAHYRDLPVGGELAPMDTVQLVTPRIAVAFLTALASAVAALLLLKKHW